MGLARHNPGGQLRLGLSATAGSVVLYSAIVVFDCQRCGHFPPFELSRVDAQRRLYRIRPEPLMEVDAWLAPFRRFWSVHVDALERHLDRMNQVPRRERKKR